MSTDELQALIQKRIEVLEFEFEQCARAGDRVSATAVTGALFEMQMLASHLGVTVRVLVPAELNAEDARRYPSSELFDHARKDRP